MPKNNFTIGLHGLAQTGKDTAATIIAQELNLAPYTIAEPVTRECAALLGISHNKFLQMGKDREIAEKIIDRSLYWPIYQSINCRNGGSTALSRLFYSKTKRELMQAVGACLRFHDEYFLIKTLIKKLDEDKSLRENHDGIVITDVRLPSEQAFVHNRLGHVIHIHNHNAKSAPPDITEQKLQILSRDFLINNKADLIEFECKVRELCNHLRLEKEANAA